MKKILLCLLGLLLPMIVNAKEYSIKDTDMTINFDEEMWYVFTRDNIKGNEELAYLEISEDYVKEFMDENSVYLDALMINENKTLEIFVRKSEIDQINNLSNLSNKDVKKLAKEIAKEQKAKKYDTYETKYKFAHLNYYDDGYYLDEYYTIVNKYGYTITAQSEEKLTKEQKKIIENVIKSIEFKVDKSLKDNTLTWWKHIGLYAVIGGATGVIIAFISNLAGKRISKKRETK